MAIGYVYKIYDNTNGNVYYGSTEQQLSQRLADHRSDNKKYKNGKKKYCSSFKILDNGDYSYSVIEQVEFNEKWELKARERFYIENNECVNILIPNRTHNEWIELNKEQILTKQKERYEKHIEQERQRKREYAEKHKEQYKEYCKNNKEQIAKKKKEYYEKNKVLKGNL